MSSLLGHAATGAAIFLCHSRMHEPHTRWALPVMVLLAIAPDFDYLALWWMGLHAHLRMTHTLLYCLAISGGAWWATRKLRARAQRPPSFAMFLLAANSHLLLDLFVGVHPLALFWPFADTAVSAPFGLLPSAGHNLVGYYLWRNLMIECGVLLPMLALLVAICRRVPRETLVPRTALVLPTWSVFAIWSLQLSR